MSANQEGGKKTAKKLLAADPDYYRKIGSKSKAGWVAKGRKPRGFSVMPKDKLKEISARAGRISRRAR